MTQKSTRAPKSNAHGNSSQAKPKVQHRRNFTSIAGNVHITSEKPLCDDFDEVTLKIADHDDTRSNSQNHLTLLKDKHHITTIGFEYCHIDIDSPPKIRGNQSIDSINQSRHVTIEEMEELNRQMVEKLREKQNPKGLTTEQLL